VGSGTAPNAGTRRAEIIAAFGTVVEWYDFSLYVYLAPVYARVFFEGGSSTDLIATFAVFAVAYLARPVGAAFFGWFGDRRGRKQSLVVSAAMMTVLLAVNGLLPGEEAIGAAAVLLLVMVRLGLGFAIGGEYSGILVFLVETAEDRRRGFVASWSPATAGLGSLLAVGVSALVTGLLSQAQLDAWGWRIPVFVGAALAASVLFLRRGLSETVAFDRMRSEHALAKSPLREALNARRALMATFLLSAVGSVAYYLNVTYVPTYLSTYEHVGAATALRWSTIATAVMLVATPAFGLLADVVGRRWALALIGVFLATTTLPLFALLGAADAALVVVGACLLAVTAGAWSAASASAVPEQFPGRVRFSGIAVGYNAAVAIFGGLTPLVATLLIEATGSSLLPALGCAALGVVGVVVALRLRETARRPLLR
jgi:MHS family proline/betaine transporter-like MFS transporter